MKTHSVLYNTLFRYCFYMAGVQHGLRFDQILKIGLFDRKLIKLQICGGVFHHV